MFKYVVLVAALVAVAFCADSQPPANGDECHCNPNNTLKQPFTTCGNKPGINRTAAMDTKGKNCSEAVQNPDAKKLFQCYNEQTKLINKDNTVNATVLKNGCKDVAKANATNKNEIKTECENVAAAAVKSVGDQKPNSPELAVCLTLRALKENGSKLMELCGKCKPQQDSNNHGQSGQQPTKANNTAAAPGH